MSFPFMDLRRAGPGSGLAGSGPLARGLSLLCQVFYAPPGTRATRRLRRVLVGLVALPPFLLLQIANALCLRLDDWLFPGYRAVSIRSPLFVLGAPRTGTTAAHRWLARDPRFTTLTTWECLFAPSVAQRRAVLFLARLDRRLGAPLARLLARAEACLPGWLDEVHPVSLRAPEEDYLTLLSTFECFALVIPFPDSNWLWRLARCDEALPRMDQDRLLARYRGYLQRHLYVHGQHLSVLSKNASFAGMAQSLARHFPDARFVVCERDAAALARSQFAALEDARWLFGLPRTDPLFRDRMLATLAFYLANLQRLGAALPGSRLQTLPMSELSEDPQGSLARIYRSLLGAAPPAALADALGQAAKRPHRPRRPPPIRTLGLTPGQLRERLTQAGGLP